MLNSFFTANWCSLLEIRNIVDISSPHRPQYAGTPSTGLVIDTDTDEDSLGGSGYGSDHSQDSAVTDSTMAFTSPRTQRAQQEEKEEKERFDE